MTDVVTKNSADESEEKQRTVVNKQKALFRTKFSLKIQAKQEKL